MVLTPWLMFYERSGEYQASRAGLGHDDSPAAVVHFASLHFQPSSPVDPLKQDHEVTFPRLGVVMSLKKIK